MGEAVRLLFKGCFKVSVTMGHGINLAWGETGPEVGKEGWAGTDIPLKKMCPEPTVPGPALLNTCTDDRRKEEDSVSKVGDD